MKPENQIYAGLILLLHALLIAIGMAVVYIIPTSDDPTTSVGLDLSNLNTQRHSDEELHSYLDFLELSHRDMLVSNETLAAILAKDKTLVQLDFFSSVAANDRADYLAQRLSANEIEDAPYRWKLSLQDATHEDAHTLFYALNRIHSQTLKDIALAFEPPIEVAGMDDNIWETSAAQNPSNESVLGQTTPMAAALLAVILVVIVWTLCLPANRRRLPFSTSLFQLFISSFLCSTVGAGIGYLVEANVNQKWEAKTVVQVQRSPFSKVGALTPATRFLTDTLHKKLEIKNRLGKIKRKSFIAPFVTEKDIKNWQSFKPLATHNSLENAEEDTPHEDMLCQYISERLEIEIDPKAKSIYTLRFRCGNKNDAASVVQSLISRYTDQLEKAQEEATFGAQMADNYCVTRLANTEVSKVGWPRIGAGHVSQGALIGIIFTLVTLSSTRVLAGVPPV